MITIAKKTDRSFTVDGVEYSGGYHLMSEGGRVVLVRPAYGGEYVLRYDPKKITVDGQVPADVAEALSLLEAVVPEPVSSSSPGGGTSVSDERVKALCASVSIPFDHMSITDQAAFLFIVGQSNAEQGAAIPTGERKGASFFTNVKTVSYSTANNNVDDETKWAWRPFTSNFDYDLGRSTSDISEWHFNTYPLGTITDIPGWILSGPGSFSMEVTREDSKRGLAFPNFDTASSVIKVASIPVLPTDTKYFNFDITATKGSRWGMGIMAKGADNATSFAGYGKHFLYVGISIDTGDNNRKNPKGTLVVYELTGSAALKRRVSLDTAMPNYSSATGFALDTTVRFSIIAGATAGSEIYVASYRQDGETAFTEMGRFTLPTTSVNLNGGSGEIGLAFGLGIVKNSGLGSKIHIAGVTGESL